MCSEEKTSNLVLLTLCILVARFRWNSMSRLEKVYLKNSVMELIANVRNGWLEVLCFRGSLDKV